MSISAPKTRFISNSVLLNAVSPFLIGTRVKAVSKAGGDLYGCNHPGDNLSKYVKKIWDDLDVPVFEYDTLFTGTPETSAAGADQLLQILMVNKTPIRRVSGDTAPATGEWCIAAGGGTGVGATGIQTDGAGNTAGATTISIRHTAMATGTETIALGDILTISGHAYKVMSDSFAFDDDNPVDIDIYPALAGTVADSTAVVITAGTGLTVILGDTPDEEDTLEFFAMDSDDIVHQAMTAGREYNQEMYSFLYSADAVNLSAFAPI